MSDPSFWQNRAATDEKIKAHGELQNVVTRYHEIEKGLAALRKEFSENAFFEVQRKFRELELEELFKGKYDTQSAAVSVYPGAGGEDAEDWARMLFEMYGKYAAKRKWQIAILDDSPNRRTFEVKGQYAYGYLKGEMGVHRLVRISPFSSQKLRHTSFALVEVMPDLPPFEELKLEIPEKDLKVEFFRSGGPGGQNVNKVETAVRVIHIPTGIAVSSSLPKTRRRFT